MKKIISSILFLLLTVASVAQQQPYYNGIDFNLNGQPLKSALTSKIIDTHTNTLSYSEIWEAIKNTDIDPNNNNNVLLIYGHPNATTGTYARTRSKNLNGGNSNQWNREHVYAKSLGTPNLQEAGPGADAHHLRAADVSWNSTRGNRKFTSGSGNSTTVGSNWYPGDEWKGDVARMMMYMYLRYDVRCKPTNVGVGSTTSFDDMIDLFLQWNADDPVSQVEIQRNTYLGNSNNNAGQGNRNPFIDNPYLATKIWGGPVAEDRWGVLENKDFSSIEFGLYPNPATEKKVYVQTAETIHLIQIHSIDGKLIQEIKNPQFENSQFEISNLNSGFYIITLKSDNKSTAKKLIVK